MSDAFDLNRRRFCEAVAAVVAVPLGMAGAQQAADAQGAIQTFQIQTPQAELDDMRRRIKSTRWPEKETVADTSQGVPLAVMQTLADYWAGGYDWRKCEAKLNALPQFTTEIDGQNIYFIHVRSKHANALPIIVTHGWPGSPIEQLKIIDPLTNPTAYGAAASDAFDVVIPAIPGYGFSSRPSTPWGPEQTARAWDVLMKRLGYSKYVAQGGDVGVIVTNLLGQLAPPGLLGIHSNFPYVVPPEIAVALRNGDPPSPSFTPDEKRAYEQLLRFDSKHFAYGAENRTRPQTLYGLTEPIGLAAWLLDHGDGWGQPSPIQLSAILGQPVDGHSAGSFTRDDLLDNFTLYYLSNTGISSCRFYVYITGNAKSVSVPAAVSVFPGEIYQAPRSWTATVYHNIIYYSINQIQQGGHFAAWEQPEIFSEELRKAFRPLRVEA